MRILPLYLLVLGAYCVLILVLGQEPDGAREARFERAVPYYLSPLPEVPHFSFPNVPFEISWSLGIEEKFYFVWPLVAFVALRRLTRHRVLIAAGLLLGGLVASAFLGPVGDALYEYAHILAGCLVALALHHGSGYRRLAVLGRPSVVTAVVATLLTLHILRPELPNPSNYAFTVAGSLALVGLITSRSWLTRSLEARPMVFLGRLSYAFYLVHQLGLSFAERVVPEAWGHRRQRGHDPGGARRDHPRVHGAAPLRRSGR